MTVTLPDEMRAGLEARAKAAGYVSVDELAEDVLCDEATQVGTLDWIEANRSALLALAEQGRNSPAIENPKGFLAELVRRTESGESVEDMRS